MTFRFLILSVSGVDGKDMVLWDHVKHQAFQAHVLWIPNGKMPAAGWFFVYEKNNLLSSATEGTVVTQGEVEAPARGDNIRLGDANKPTRIGARIGFSNEESHRSSDRTEGYTYRYGWLDTAHLAGDRRLQEEQVYKAYFIINPDIKVNGENWEKPFSIEKIDNFAPGMTDFLMEIERAEEKRNSPPLPEASRGDEYGRRPTALRPSQVARAVRQQHRQRSASRRSFPSTHQPPAQKPKAPKPEARKPEAPKREAHMEAGSSSRRSGQAAYFTQQPLVKIAAAPSTPAIREPESRHVIAQPPFLPTSRPLQTVVNDEIVLEKQGIVMLHDKKEMVVLLDGENLFAYIEWELAREHLVQVGDQIQCAVRRICDTWRTGFQVIRIHKVDHAEIPNIRLIPSHLLKLVVECTVDLRTFELRFEWYYARGLAKVVKCWGHGYVLLASKVMLPDGTTRCGNEVQEEYQCDAACQRIIVNCRAIKATVPTIFAHNAFEEDPWMEAHVLEVFEVLGLEEVILKKREMAKARSVETRMVRR